MSKNKKTKKEEKQPITFNSIVNNPRTIIIFLIVLLLGLSIWIINVNNSVKFYSGQIAELDLSVSELHYYTDKKMTYFFANNAVYGGEDKDIYKFDIKYVIDANGKEEVIEDFNTEFAKKQSLKDMILTYSKFKVVDLRKQSKPVFTDDMKDNIDKLKLVIKASTTKDGDYDIVLTYKVEIKRIN